LARPVIAVRRHVDMSKHIVKLRPIHLTIIWFSDIKEATWLNSDWLA